MKKNVLKLVLIFMCLCVFTGCGNNDKKDNQFSKEYESLNNKNDESGNKYEKIEIDGENPFVYKSAGEVVDMIRNKQSFVVYFGYASSNLCRIAIPTLIETANEFGLEEIYYVDISEIRDELSLDEVGNKVTNKQGHSDYYKLLILLDNVLDDYIIKDKDGNTKSSGEKRINEPSIISIINGSATILTNGVSDNYVEGQEVTDTMKNEAKQEIQNVIKTVLEHKRNCIATGSC